MPRLPRFAESFREPSFTLFFAGQVGSNVGTWFQNLSLSLIILESTGSAQALGAVMAAQFAPILVLSIPAGLLLRRWSPRMVMLCTSIGSCVGVLLLAAVLEIATSELWLMCVIVALLGGLNAFERVAAQSLVSTLVDPSKLGGAVATYTIALSAARSVGPALAGITFATVGGTACLLVNAASFFLVAVVLVFIRVGAHADPSEGQPGRQETPLRMNRWFITVMIANWMMSLMSVNLTMALTALVTLWFDGGPTTLGAIHGLNAVGGVVGGFIAAGRTGFGPRALIVGCSALGGALIANAFAPTVIVVAVLGPVLGIALGFYQGTINAAAQSAVPRSQISRAMSLMIVGQFGMIPVGAVLTGVIVDLASAPVAVACAGGAAVLVAAFVALRTRKG